MAAIANAGNTGRATTAMRDASSIDTPVFGAPLDLGGGHRHRRPPGTFVHELTNLVIRDRHD